jgi:hypothetical protein
MVIGVVFHQVCKNMDFAQTESSKRRNYGLLELSCNDDLAISDQIYFRNREISVYYFRNIPGQYDRSLSIPE